jgi:hypothetical protein
MALHGVERGVRRGMERSQGNTATVTFNNCYYLTRACLTRACLPHSELPHTPL